MILHDFNQCNTLICKYKDISPLCSFCKSVVLMFMNPAVWKVQYIQGQTSESCRTFCSTCSSSPWSWAHTAEESLCSCWRCRCSLRSPAAPGWFPRSPSAPPCAAPCRLYRCAGPDGTFGGRSTPRPSHTDTQHTASPRGSQLYWLFTDIIFRFNLSRIIMTSHVDV